MGNSCTTCKHSINGYCTKNTNEMYFYLENCSSYKRKITTNIEYIRSLSSEEIAKIIIHCPYCPPVECKGCEKKCVECWTKFLNMEHVSED